MVFEREAHQSRAREENTYTYTNLPFLISIGEEGQRTACPGHRAGWGKTEGGFEKANGEWLAQRLTVIRWTGAICH